MKFVFKDILFISEVLVSIFFTKKNLVVKFYNIRSIWVAWEINLDQDYCNLLSLTYICKTFCTGLLPNSRQCVLFKNTLELVAYFSIQISIIPSNLCRIRSRRTYVIDWKTGSWIQLIHKIKVARILFTLSHTDTHKYKCVLVCVEVY